MSNNEYNEKAEKAEELASDLQITLQINDTPTTPSSSYNSNIIEEKPPVIFFNSDETLSKIQKIIEDKQNEPDIVIIHFNDVYELDLTPYFAGVVNSIRAQYPHLLLLFGGDGYSPSVMSAVTRGKHMVPVLNELKVDAAVMGNHDFDYGIERAISLNESCTFPWLLANYVINGTPIAKCKDYLIFERNKLRIGVIGVAERGWKDSVTNFPSNVEYLDIVQKTNEISEILRVEENVDFVICLTHSRSPVDKHVATFCDIDLILGGHDHEYYVYYTNKVPIVNSGTEFANLSLVKVYLGKNEIIQNGDDEEVDQSLYNYSFLSPNALITVQRFDISKSMEADPIMSAVISESQKLMESKLSKILGETTTAWDVRNHVCRSGECNVGDLLTDLMRSLYETDAAIICGGTLRSNDIYGPGLIKMGDIMKIFPFSDTVVVIAIKGKYILEALENGVSQYPVLDGRFPQVSGIRFSFDPSHPPGHRIVQAAINRIPIENEQIYKVATKCYLLKGGDGYTSLPKYESLIVDDEAGLNFSVIIRNYFMQLRVLDAFQHNNRIRKIASNAFLKNNKFQVRHILPSPTLDGRIAIVGENQRASHSCPSLAN